MCLLIVCVYIGIYIFLYIFVFCIRDCGKRYFDLSVYTQTERLTLKLTLKLWKKNINLSFLPLPTCRYNQHPGSAGHSVPPGSERGGSSPGAAGGCWEAAGPPDPRGGSLPGENVWRLEGPWGQMKTHTHSHTLTAITKSPDWRLWDLWDFSALLLAVVHKGVQSDHWMLKWRDFLHYWVVPINVSHTFIIYSVQIMSTSFKKR